jgi:hypothetical protein
VKIRKRVGVELVRVGAEKMGDELLGIVGIVAERVASGVKSLQANVGLPWASRIGLPAASTRVEQK